MLQHNLQHPSVGVADIKKSLELNLNNPTVSLRKETWEYHEKDLVSGIETCAEQKLERVDANFAIWNKGSLESKNGSESGIYISRTQSEIKYDWYYMEAQLIIIVMIKNSLRNHANVGFFRKRVVCFGETLGPISVVLQHKAHLKYFQQRMKLKRESQRLWDGKS